MKKPFYMTKSFVLGLISALGITAAFAAGVPEKIVTDLMVIGKGSSTDAKQIEFNTGDSPNILLQVDDSQNGAFTTNQLSLGDGTDTVQSLIFDQATGDITFGVDASQNALINSNQLSIGDGTAANQTLVFDKGGTNPFIRWDNANSRLVFSNDGSAEKAIGSGSGSGGGTNVLADDNSDFEVGSPPSSWTASGGSFVSETTTPLFGDQSGSWDASASAQTLDSILAPIKSGFLGRVCSAQIEYRYASGASGDYKMVARQFDDSGATELSVGEVDLAVTGSNRSTAQLFFNCPDDINDDLRVRIESTVADPGAIILDDAFIGEGRNTQSVIPGNALFENILTADVTSDGTIGDLTFSNLEVGKYYTVYLQAAINLAAGTGADANINIVHDSATIGVADFVNGNNTPLRRYKGSTVVTFQATTTTLTFSGNSLSANDVVLGNGNKNETYAQLILRNDITSSPSEAITLETIGEHWDVNISGANPDLGTSNLTSPTEITDPSLTMTINAGSSSAEIPCSTTNSSTGTTCSAGDEGVGIVITPSTAGRYRVCAEFSHNINFATGGVDSDVSSTFEWFETPNNAQTINQRGKSRIQSGRQSNSNNTETDLVHFPHNLCGTFIFNSAGTKRTLRLMYEQEASGTITNNNLLADALASAGDRDIHITVEKLDQQMPTPVFTDLTNSLASKVESGEAIDLYYATLTHPTTVSNEIGGDWIASVANPSTGRYELTLNTNTLSEVHACFAQENTDNDMYTFIAGGGEFVVFSRDASGTLTDAVNFKVMCLAQRP